MKKLTIYLGAALAALFISGCAHDNELAKAQADANVAQANARVAEATASAEESRAVTALAAKIDAGGASAYLIAKALKGIGVQSQAVQVSQPQSIAGMAWQALLQLTDLGLRAYGIKAVRDTNITQSNNNRDVALSTNATFSAGMGAIAQAGAAGYPYIQAPQPNITQTLSGTGVLGSGSYTAPVTTTTTTTRNCNGGNAAAGGAGGAGAAGTTSGGAGGLAGSGGSASGGQC
jgi:hypothetical protein